MKGIFDLLADEYHADAVHEKRPSLSASIAHVLCARSPLHAWTEHPRLNPDYAPEEDKKFDIGTVAHAILLEGADVVYVCQYPDWRTDAAKEAKEHARAIGRVPLLAKDLARVQEMVASAKRQLVNVDVHPPMFADGKPEQTLAWEEDGGCTRGRRAA